VFSKSIFYYLISKNVNTANLDFQFIIRLYIDYVHMFRLRIYSSLKLCSVSYLAIL